MSDLTGRLTALAEAWDACAADMQTISDTWRSQGDRQLADRARGRARQLTACADDLRAVLRGGPVEVTSHNPGKEGP